MGLQTHRDQQDVSQQQQTEQGASQEQRFLVYIWFLVPESKGKRLEEIEVYWKNGRRWQS